MKAFFDDASGRMIRSSSCPPARSRPTPKKPARVERPAGRRPRRPAAASRHRRCRDRADRPRCIRRNTSIFLETHPRPLEPDRGRLGRGDPQHPPRPPQRRLSEIGGRPGRVPHDRHLLPDLGRDLGGRLLVGADRAIQRRRWCWPASARSMRSAARRGIMPSPTWPAGSAFSTTPASRRSACAKAGAAPGDPRRRSASRQRHARHLLCTRRDVLTVSIHADPDPVLPVLLGPCRRNAAKAPGWATTSTCRCRAAPAMRPFSTALGVALSAYPRLRRGCRGGGAGSGCASRAIRSRGLRSRRRVLPGSGGDRAAWPADA